MDLRNSFQLEPIREAYDTIILDFHYKPNIEIEADSVTARFLRSSLKTDEIDWRKSKVVRSLFQSTAYVLSNLPNAKKAPILLGPPHTGKSVWLNLCARLIGDENVRYLSLQDMTDKFRGGLLQGARLVLCHEVRLGFLRRLDIPKAIISGNPITIEAKGVQPWTYKSDVKLFMAANALPSLGEIDAGGAFAERLLVIPFHAHEGANDPELLDKLYEERDMLFSVIFQTMPDFLEHGMQFEEVEESRQLLQEYRINGNPLTAFLTSNYETGSDDDCIGTKILFDEYRRFCEANVFPTCSISEFRPQLTQLGHFIKKRRIPGQRNPISTVSRLKRKLEL